MQWGFWATGTPALALRRSRIAPDGAGVATGSRPILTERSWREGSSGIPATAAHTTTHTSEDHQSVTPLRGGEQDGQGSSLRVEESDCEGQLTGALARPPTGW